jgi:hypothetical protein
VVLYFYPIRSQCPAVGTRIISQRFLRNDISTHLVRDSNLHGVSIKTIEWKVVAIVTYLQVHLLALSCFGLTCGHCYYSAVSTKVCPSLKSSAGVCSHNALGVIRPITAGDKKLTICMDVTPIYIYMNTSDIKIQHGISSHLLRCLQIQ